MKIKVLGSGCARCHQLKQTTREVVKELGIDVEIEDWALEDPAGKSLNQIIKIRDEIKKRVIRLMKELS